MSEKIRDLGDPAYTPKSYKKENKLVVIPSAELVAELRRIHDIYYTHHDCYTHEHPCGILECDTMNAIRKAANRLERLEKATLAYLAAKENSDQFSLGDVQDALHDPYTDRRNAEAIEESDAKER